jgi:hypothetical protein
MSQLSKADTLLKETNPDLYFVKNQLPGYAAKWRCGDRGAAQAMLNEWNGILKVRLEVNRSQEKIDEARRYIKILESLI